MYNISQLAPVCYALSTAPIFVCYSRLLMFGITVEACIHLHKPHVFVMLTTTLVI